MSEFAPPPPGEESSPLMPPSSPLEHLDSHAPLPQFGGPDLYDLTPAPAPPRRRGKVIVASTLGVLLVLGVGGAAAAAVVLHRPDVQLARAFAATQSASEGSMTLSVQADAAALATAPAGMAETLTSSSVRYAWSPGTQQMSLTYEGKQLGTLTTTDTHLTLQVDLANVPNGDGAASSLSSLAESLGPDGAVLTALADGKPVGISTGPGSALRALADKAAKASGQAGASDAAASLSSQKAAEVLNAITESVKSNTSVTSVGNDANGDHFLAKVSLKAVTETAWTRLSSLTGALATGMTKPDLAKLDGVTLDVDVWVRDGRISRIEIPLGDVARKLDPSSSTPGDIRVVAAMSTDGVAAPSGPVTEVPDSLLRTLGGDSLTTP